MIRIIYDNGGFIISQIQGSDLHTPVGVPYLDVDIPIGKYATSVDVTTTPNTVVLANLPKSETQLLQKENMEIRLALAELAEMIAAGGTI